MREAIRRPALLAWRAGHLGVAEVWLLFCCLRSSWPSSPCPDRSFPPPKSSPAGPTFRQAYHPLALGPHFFRIFFWTSFFIDFVSVFASILTPKIDPKPKKIGKNGSSNPSPVLLQFFCRFFLKLGRSSKGRTLDFARPYGTLATFLHFCLSAVGSPPLASVFDSKNHSEIAQKSIKDR